MTKSRALSDKPKPKPAPGRKRKTRDDMPCVGCMVSVIDGPDLLEKIMAHTIAITKWLEAGGDKRLHEFSPLESWGVIVDVVEKARKDGLRRCNNAQKIQ